MALLRSSVAVTLAVLFTFSVPLRAEVISSSEALALEQRAEDRVLVDEYLSRDDVAAQLAALGVDPALARVRAEALSAQELRELARRIEDEPAGGTSAIAVLGVTFLVLLILELVGVIDIFKKF